MKPSTKGVAMLWFLDTEFIDNGRTIDLISIALVSLDGREYYAHSSEYDVEACDEWLKKNVLPHLTNIPTKPRATIATEISNLIDEDESPSPEFWAYCAAYDWVALCQLYGRMLDRPEFWPYYCRDLRQELERFNLSPPKHEHNAHDALADARWARDTWLWMRAQKEGYHEHN